MSRVVLYIAQSLDGFIARPDGSIDWLTSVPYPEGRDYGYTELLNNIGTIIMGRKTYDDLLGFGGDWFYTGFDTYVVTHNKQFTVQTPDTYILTGSLADFVNKLKKQAAKDIWLVGGSQLNTAFINEGLLDKMIISIVPKLIGEGIPLFAPKPAEINWRLIGTEVFETGLVNLTYEKME